MRSDTMQSSLRRLIVHRGCLAAMPLIIAGCVCPRTLRSFTPSTEATKREADGISGVRVLDDHTLEVTLDAPKAYFIDKLTYPVAWIVHKDTIEKIETDPNGTGPYTITRHDKDVIYILKRYPNYYL